MGLGEDVGGAGRGCGRGWERMSACIPHVVVCLLASPPCMGKPSTCSPFFFQNGWVYVHYCGFMRKNCYQLFMYVVM